MLPGVDVEHAVQLVDEVLGVAEQFVRLRQVAVGERREGAGDVAIEAVVGHHDDPRAGSSLERP